MGQAVPGEFAYRKVYRYLEALIEQASGGGPCKLPSLRALSRRLRVSLATVQSAYNLLEEEGRVQCLPRSGYYAQVAAKAAAAPMHPQSPLPVQPLLERMLLGHERRLARQRASGVAPWETLGDTRLRNAVAESYTRSSSLYWRAEDVQLAPDVQALLDTVLAGLALQGGTVLVQSPCCWQVLRTLWHVPACGCWKYLQIAAATRTCGPWPGCWAPSRCACWSCRLAWACRKGGWCRRTISSSLVSYWASTLYGCWKTTLDSEHCYSGPPRTRLRDWVDPRSLLVLGAFETAVGAEAPYAYVLSHDAALAKAFAERAFRLAPLRLQALALMLGKGRSRYT